MDLNLFKQDNLFDATLSFFKDTIGLQLVTKSKLPINLKNQFDAYGIRSKRVDDIWNHVENTYYIGLLDDENFDKELSGQRGSDLDEDLKEVEKSEDEYPGILIFAVDLDHGFNPTRSNLTEINRTLNRFSQRVPALVLARYRKKISLMLADRVAYKQEWREGEKVRKVSLLRDIDLNNTHAGHLRILNDLVIPTSGTKKVENFDGLYEYWKEVLDTSELNKKFYQDLSNWYFWAIKHVRFPNEPTLEDAHEQDKELDDMLQEHRATNVIRLLTRLLFVWFIKEKGLIPEELFDIKTLQKDILKEVTPYHEQGMFKEANKESIYYKAILQNLFFATLNCPIEASSSDNRERGFRSTTRGVHFGVTYLMRYEQYFKDNDAFLELVNRKVPFLNGGLFECLDERGEKEDREDRVYIDGFSDNLPKEHKLIVPDFLFFGVEEEVDLSEDYGLKRKKYKEAAVKGLLNIFNSYKFTITENTPIEEDVALDPELLGKVFENLLASYNPETKTTARKQTGSFYTPREIVNYMVDESLIAYLKNAIEDWGISEDELDEKLHQLTSYEERVPFEGNEELHREIITALSNCTILDPACGSGAFPMGILQKMVHILQRLDPDNEIWKEVQKEKAKEEADHAISKIEDKDVRGQRLQEINEAFDERINAPDYARKIFLIENCIYGVDIQPIATQISKLRFFISLVVEQKVGEDNSDNFGIRPLPNLETKFVTANTLVDIKDNNNQISLYETDKIKRLETELKRVRSKLFSARTTDTKYKYRQEDERLRNEIADELKQSGWPNDTADKLASWDPYDQNASSPFFNPEWMFDISNGFDLIIGNPPYGAKFTKSEKDYFKKVYQYQNYQPESFLLFIEKSFTIMSKDGIMSFIIPNTWLTNLKLINIRKLIFGSTSLLNVSHYHQSVFDAIVDTEVLILKKGYDENNKFMVRNIRGENNYQLTKQDQDYFKDKDGEPVNIFVKKSELFVFDKIAENKQLKEYCNLYSGYVPYEVGKGKPKQTRKMLKNRVYHSDKRIDETYRPILRGSDFDKYQIKWDGKSWIKYGKNLAARRKPKIFFQPKIVVRQTGDSIIAVLDKEGFVCPKNTHIVISREEMDLEFVLLVLNSTVSTHYFRYLNPELGEALAEVKKATLEKIPIPEPPSSDTYKELVFALEYTSNNDLLYEVGDAYVLELYFSDHMKEKEINIHEFISNDIIEVLDKSRMEELSDSEKEKVIMELKKRWSDPENEVRKRINSFPEKSPDILKPILEG